MKKLVAMFKGLPPEMRMLIALAGLGTPIGIIYVIQRYVFPNTNPLFLMLGLAVIVGVLALLGTGIAKLFSRASRQRQRKMESDLATSAETGPVSMSLRAAVKSNNEKFFTAIKEMRKLGISVYDLPWYIVIGDSGCGKTKLINEGGLTFSTGKPEGYQLGTLNYNWWFTEDAIFIDMAGRLCNPQDDSDYREWESFLKTVGMGRKGYPINGVLLCISAEHLLQDPPEKHEQDANTMLERLRDVQSKLNVTFATYLVVTKCDKIVGFMPFFDRAERDITIKNQIFGSSRRGSFEELYDPERFGDEFNGVYVRLNELRLRRLNDDVDEQELGLAYSFPEEFRQIKEPLQTYVRTLFPPIKNPRAVKNLIFRGVYFTSATQQGGLILRHLTERLGAEAGNVFQPLESLYPRPRPHFVKELLFRKVFPEQGLVFRNEQEVVRNRQLARFLLIGSVVVGVALIALLVTSALKFGRLISEPHARAAKAETLIDKPLEALTLCGQLGQDVTTLKGSVWPTILSLGIGADRPVTDLTRIQVALFENSVLRPILAASDAALRTAKVVPDGDTTKGGVPFKAYLAAVEAYLAWTGCAQQPTLPSHLDYDSFEKLTGAATETEGAPLLAHRKEILDQARQYFLTAQGLKDARNPARFVTQTGFDPTATIRAAISNLHTYGERYVRLSEESPDPVIREWMRLRNRCARIQESYGAMLTATEGTIETQEQLDAFRKTFDENYTKFAQAMDECKWQGEQGSGFLRIPLLRDAIRKQREAWLGYQKQLQDAFVLCTGTALTTNDPVGPALVALMAGDGRDVRGLDRVLADSIQSEGLAERGYFPEFFGDPYDKLVHEVDDAFGHILVLKRGGDSAKNDELGVSDALKVTVRPVLDKVHERLATLGAGDMKADNAQAWIATLQRLLFPGKTDREAAGEVPGLATLDVRWQREKLERLNNTYQVLIRKGEGTVLLRSIETRISATGPQGFGELSADWRGTQRSTYYIPVPTVTEGPAEAKPKEAAPPPVAKPAPGGPPPLMQKPTQPPSPAAPAAPAAAPPPTAEKPAGAGQIPNFATPDYLNARAMECVQLMRFLADFGPDYYFSRASDTTPLHQRCGNLVEGAWQKYCQAYATAWSTAYKAKSLNELKRVGKWDAGWESFANAFRSTAGAENEARNAVRDELQPALAEILHATRWANYASDSGWWLEQKDEYYGGQKRRVAQLYDAALQEQWSGGAFARSATAAGTAADPKPWETLAAQAAAKWGDWCNAVGGAARLPRKFDGGDSPAKPLTINWGDIIALRTDTGLKDERLTQQIIDFQQQAQLLLSAELTSIYCGLQADAFAEQVPYGGWPYLNEQGDGLTALETVTFEQFTKFLAWVQRADAALGPLDQGLPDEPIRQARRTFLKSCNEWRDFLALGPQGNATPLDVTVWTEDPLGDPQGKVKVDDTAQHFYKQVCLNIGLRSPQTNDPTTARPLCFQTTERGKARSLRTVWEWSRTPDLQEVTFELTDGIQPEGKNYTYPKIKPSILGKPSPLALCAYFHRYGNFTDGSWIVSHGMRLADKFTEAGHAELAQVIPQERFIGEKFIFQLQSGRALPGPIQRLGSAAPAPTSKP